MTTKNENDIRLLQSKADSMTFDEFWSWVNNECSHIVLCGDLADFDYGSVTATIDAKNDRLCGVFDCWDEHGNWEDTIRDMGVHFKAK